MEVLGHIFEHALIDTLRLIPFLFVTYLAMEFLEHHSTEKSQAAIQKAGFAGPFLGALIGVVPQCGFSAAAATLYAGRVVTLGTLIAVFLSTSDEMLPILIAEQAPISLVVKVLALKAAIGMVAGFVIDLALRRTHHDGDHHTHIHELCEEEHCDCSHGVLRSSLIHTLQVSFFIFLITLGLGAILHTGGEEILAEFMSGNPIFSVMAASLVGLIPNCAASVAITELYLQGILSAGAMIGGLLTSAGIGLLVLFRTNRSVKENLGIVALVFGIGVIAGLICILLGLTL